MITSHCNTAIVPGENLIYCSTLQMAWNELCDFMGGPILLPELQDEQALLTVDELNRRVTTKDDLDPKSYLALAGMVKGGVLDQIRKGLQEKFSETSKIDFSGLAPDDIIAYAFLQKILEFHEEFNEIENFSFMNTPVKAFGIEKVKQITPISEQVRILHYKSSSQFTIAIDTKSGETITLARLQPGKTLRETLGLMKMDSSDSLRAGDVLKVPKIAFDLEKHYTELIGSPMSITGRSGEMTPSEYHIHDAVQLIKFNLNEKGARLRSEAAFMCKRCVSFSAEIPRQFIFDGPFLICLRQAWDSDPYFVAWIENTDLLEK